MIHHSHTDIGYTERQDKIIRYHSDFIRQAIRTLDAFHEKEEQGAERFVWQCENYWQVENFYRMAPEEEKRKFERYVKSGEIGLSVNYLNMTELVSDPVLEHALAKMEAYGKSIGHPVTAGMCADVNGMAWGYAEALYRHGVRGFYSALHPHHGMFPLYRKVYPFYWETPEGHRLLMWNGEHYHFGNELFLAPHAGTTYMIEDEFSEPIRRSLLLKESPEETARREEEIALARTRRYLENLEKEEYPYDIVPVMVSGAITDNAPPSGKIAERLRFLNERYGGQATFRMATLEEFFDAVRERCADIPVYGGDFTDWWADGVGSTPAEVKLYREAVRKYSLCRKADPQGEAGNSAYMEQAAEDMMLYAEHTWGYSSSVSEPWESLVGALEAKKGAYAVNANTCAAKNLDQIMAAEGEVSIAQDKPQRYLVYNPHAHALRTAVCLYIEFWEYIDGLRYDSSMPVVVRDEESGEVLASQVKRIARATQVEIVLALQAGEKRRLSVHLAQRAAGTPFNCAHIGAEGVEDLRADTLKEAALWPQRLREPRYREDEERIETERFVIETSEALGVTRIWDKKDRKELLRAGESVGAFAGVYEVTECGRMDGAAACEVRRQMGRNRKSYATKRYTARLRNRKITENGDVYAALSLEYELPGTRMYTVFLKIYKELPRIDALVRIHKESRWEPENLYVALPFTAGDGGELYVDKTGCIIRPGIDQLPGTCEDFYLIQNAMVWKAKESGSAVAVITRDAPLMALGELTAKPVTLCSGQNRERNGAMVYSWPMNNFWETNFKVDLGGFYEFAYTVEVLDGCTVKEIFARCEEENEGLLAGYAE